jgi:hypothetical protein
MQDVGVLVGERDTEPIVRVADERLGQGWDRCDLNGIVGKRRGPAVREIGLVDENHLNAACREAEHRLHLSAHVLGDRGEPDHERLDALVRMDIEMRRADRLESEAPVVPVRGDAWRGDKKRRHHDDRAPDTPPRDGWRHGAIPTNRQRPSDPQGARAPAAA